MRGRPEETFAQNGFGLYAYGWERARSSANRGAPFRRMGSKQVSASRSSKRLKFLAMPAPSEGKAVETAGSRQPLRPFSQSLPMALLRAREAVMRHFRPSLQAAGLTEQQWRTMRALSG